MGVDWVAKPTLQATAFTQVASWLITGGLAGLYVVPVAQTPVAGVQTGSGSDCAPAWKQTVASAGWAGIVRVTSLLNVFGPGESDTETVEAASPKVASRRTLFW